MNSISLEKQTQLDEILQNPGCSVIFKHNTTCPISKNARINFERNLSMLPPETKVYFLDLLSYRDLSNSIAEQLDVVHESPQVLMVRNGKCEFHQALYDISPEQIAQAISKE
jgi:bacillithiol system protein YtxJ